MQQNIYNSEIIYQKIRGEHKSIPSIIIIIKRFVCVHENKINSLAGTRWLRIVQPRVSWR